MATTASDPIVILSYARTPMGSFQGALSPLSATELGATAVRAAVERAGISGEQVDKVFMFRAVSVLRELLELDLGVERPEELGGDVEPGDDHCLTAVHLGGEASVSGYGRGRCNIAAQTEILREYAGHEFLHVELVGKSHDRFPLKTKSARQIETAKLFYKGNTRRCTPPLLFQSAIRS